MVYSVSSCTNSSQSEAKEMSKELFCFPVSYWALDTTSFIGEGGEKKTKQTTPASHLLTGRQLLFRLNVQSIQRENQNTFLKPTKLSTKIQCFQCFNFNFQFILNLRNSLFLGDNFSFQTVGMQLSCTQIFITSPHILHLEECLL